MLAWGSWSEPFLGALAGAFLGAAYAGLSARRGPAEPVYLPRLFLLVGAFVAIALSPPLLAASAGGRVAATSRRSCWR